jgi:precorrin-6A/cobalt-precorrin-6A reductase
MILLLSGTSEGRWLGQRLRDAGLPFVASVTTPEARVLFTAVEPPPEVYVTRFHDEALAAFLDEHHIAAILDATHPFASRISEQAMQAAARAHIPYVRYERPDSVLSADRGQMHVVPDVAAAAQVCLEHGRRIFLTSGTKTLAAFRDVLARKWVMARILPTVASLTQALEAGLPPAQILAMRGPFSQTLERVLLQDYRIDLLVTKESGTAGGLDTKLAAAVECGIPAVVISRPELTYPNRYHDLEQTVQAVINLMGTHHGSRAPHTTSAASSATRSMPSAAPIR